MKQKFIPLLLALLSCWLWSNQQALAQCEGAYNSAKPPPYPYDYPCMQEILDNNPECCNVEFDLDCLDKLRTHCDLNGGGQDADGNYLADCWFDQCKKDGCESTRMPVCPNFCESYFSPNPPPGPNPPQFLDGILFEIFLFDGECCVTEFDNICETLLDSIGFYICDDEDATTLDDATPELGCTHTPLGDLPVATVNLKVFLEGPYNGDGTMSTNLGDNGIVPLTNPFTGVPWNYAGDDNVTSLPDDVVDWVLVEARSASNSNRVEVVQAGFLLKDGSITDTDGVADGISLVGISPNSDHFVVVRTRNHLAVMSATAITFSASNPVYNFSESADKVFGNDPSNPTQTKQMSDGTFALLGGDLEANGTILVGDLNVYYQNIGVFDEYLSSDINLDQIVSVTDFNIFGTNAGTVGIDQIRFDD